MWRRSKRGWGGWGRRFDAAMSPDLLRQRRNLIAISSVLIVFDFAQVSIAKINVLGTELLVGDARVLLFFAWMIWVYAFLRYYQYLRAEGDLKIAAAFRGGIDSRLSQYVFSEIQKKSVSKISSERTGFRWRYIVEDYDTKTGSVRPTHSGSLPFRKVLWWGLRSAFEVAVHTPKATDHILPILLAIAAPVLKLAKWGGGLFW